MPQPKKSKSSTLTKEHFDQAVKNLVTDETLDKKLTGLDDKINKKFADQTQRLMGHTNTQINRIESKLEEMDEGINIKLDAIFELLNFKNRIEALEKKVAALENKK